MIALMTPVKNTSTNSSAQPVRPEAVPVREPALGQQALDERRAVERRDRQQVEEPEQQVDQREVEDDLEQHVAGRAVERARRSRAPRSTSNGPRGRPRSSAAKFVNGPARLTRTMSRRGRRRRAGSTGTGFA